MNMVINMEQKNNRFFDNKDIEKQIGKFLLLIDYIDIDLELIKFFYKKTSVPASIILDFIKKIWPEMKIIRDIVHKVFWSKKIWEFPHETEDSEIYALAKVYLKAKHYTKHDTENIIIINWNSIIKKQIEKLPLGQVLFNIPKLMKIGKKELRLELAKI